MTLSVMALPPDERRDRAKVNAAVRRSQAWPAAACRHRGPIRRSEGDGVVPRRQARETKGPTAN